MEEHKPSGTMIFGVFDGHGEAGDLVSHFFTDRLASRLVAHPRFLTDVAAALRDELDRLEKQLLAGAPSDGGLWGSPRMVVRWKTLDSLTCGGGAVGRHAQQFHFTFLSRASSPTFLPSLAAFSHTLLHSLQTPRSTRSSAARRASSACSAAAR
jgi:hypothetical protein